MIYSGGMSDASCRKGLSTRPRERDPRGNFQGGSHIHMGIDNELNGHRSGVIDGDVGMLDKTMNNKREWVWGC